MSLRGLSAVLCAAFLVSCAAPTPPPSEPPARDGVFIHVTAGPDQPHRLLMPLKMAEMMAADHEVLVYFDIDGVLAVVKDAPDASLEPFPSLHAELNALADAGVTLLACPTCMKVAGKTPDDLRPGVAVADRKAFFDFTKGRILSLDY